MKKILFLLAIAMSITSFKTPTLTIVGQWESVDEKTKKPTSVLEIYKGEDGLYYGKILEILNRPEASQDLYCIDCPKKDERYNQPLLGMVIISKMKAAKDVKSASGGDILDPESGNIYSCSIALIKGGQQLKVRGYIGFSIFGRTQIWNRK